MYKLLQTYVYESEGTINKKKLNRRVERSCDMFEITPGRSNSQISQYNLPSSVCIP